MRFDEFWAEIEKLKKLPNEAIKQIPMSLSEDTKRKMMMKRPDVAVEILKASISEIEYGSVESIDSLVRKSL